MCAPCRCGADYNIMPIPWGKLFVKFLVLTCLSIGYIQGIVFSSQKNVAFWDETEPFGQTNQPAADLRLPLDVVPSFYRLKLKTDLERSIFTGQVAITIRANRQVKEIILHSKNLNITNGAKLSKQVYERVAILRTKRDADNTTAETTTDSSNVTETDTTKAATTASTATTAMTPTTAIPTTEIPAKPVDTQVTHSNTESVKILTVMESTGDRLVILLGSVMKPNVDYILELSFSGEIKDSLAGFYKSSYLNNDGEKIDIAVTQFEPTMARAAFPCFDEPAFKAKFEISVAHGTNVSVLSNMKVTTTELIPEEPGMQWTHFERSVKMSTYLVAYVLSNFKSLETSYLSKDNTTKTIKIWARPEFINKANYALNITPKILKYYEDVFGIPYALDKVDLIAIPDFASGAMENWGLITFRETTLLFDPATSPPRDKQSVAIDVAHELAHQWFGNLVTMRWWTDLWLNEGFATYIEYVGVDYIEPQWNMFESFSRDKMDLLRSDALKNTMPLSKEVRDAGEISQKFDEISYTKGANLIRMLNHTISEELFRAGLLIYLNEWKYSNAEENDLWEAMSRATASDPGLAGLSIVEFMNSWTRQAGYPLLKVNRNYATGVVELEQRVFTSSPQPYQSVVDQLWPIPVSYTAVDAPSAHWSTRPRAWLKGRIGTVHTDLNATQPLYVNVGAIGYYRVNYDPQNWQLLSTALHSGALESPITKAQMIDDAFNLAKTGHVNYSCALGLTTYAVEGEDSKIVWDLILNNMAFLRYNLRDVPGYPYFLEYMKLLLKKQLQKMNYGLDPPKDDNEAFLVENLLSWECFLEEPRCLSWAKEQFENWVAQGNLTNNTIPAHLRPLVLSTAVRRGGRREFELLWTLYRNTTEPAAQAALVGVLPSTRDDALMLQLLERSLTEIPKQLAVGAWAVDAGTAGVAQNFLLDNFPRVYRRFTDMDAFLFSTVLSSAFGFITSQYELDRLKMFAIKNKADLLPMSQTLQKIVDMATFRIDWRRRHAQGMMQWFQDYVTGKIGPDGSTTTEVPTVTVTTEDTNSTTPGPNANSTTDTTANITIQTSTVNPVT